MTSHPADWFNLFFPKHKTRFTHSKTVDNFTSWTNINSKMLNAGDFSKDEIIVHLGLYLLHSISPSPQIEIRFKSKHEDPVNDSDFHEVFGRNVVT